MLDVRVNCPRVAGHSVACGSGGVGALRLGWVLPVISGLFCCALSLQAQTSDSTTTDQPNNSWTATSELTGGDLLPTRTPVRITESHSQNGNRTFEERTVQIQGMDGRLAPYQEIEMETLQVDANTVRTTRRAFGPGVNGARSLIQVAEEEKHVLPSGGSNVLRTTFNPDLNGKLQPVQREMVETKMISKDVEETNTMVMLPNINSGLAPAFKTRELRKRSEGNTIESKKTTLLPDGAGNWQVNEVRQATTRQEGTNRITEVRVSRLDSEGKLGEISHVVSKESGSVSGEKRSVVESYSIDVPGTARDSSLHLVERKTSTGPSSSTGEGATEQRIEQINPGDPGAGLRVSILVNDKMAPAPPGEQSTVTIRARDTNGSFGTVSVDTTKSDRILTFQIQPTPSEQPK